MLCLLALRDEEAREFLREQNWREMLAQVPDGEILARILRSDLRPDDAASLNAFMVDTFPAGGATGLFVAAAKGAAQCRSDGRKMVARHSAGCFATAT